MGLPIPLPETPEWAAQLEHLLYANPVWLEQMLDKGGDDLTKYMQGVVETCIQAKYRAIQANPSLDSIELRERIWPEYINPPVPEMHAFALKEAPKRLRKKLAAWMQRIAAERASEQTECTSTDK